MNLIDAIDEADPTGCAIWAIAVVVVALCAVAVVASVKLVVWAVGWGLS